ncbi:FAD:protein FMN transferase [Neobacillus sp. LXY-1]|uniref:FAD:protein FMN transferase n=1 Tax=Neobacillus sp. LXY-1 TaxID=3379133 RepID=UPI003EE2BEF4
MIAKPAVHDDLDILAFEAMNTNFYIAVTDCQLKNWKDVIGDWIKYVENDWSRFNSENELDSLNNLQPGETIPISPPLLDVLSRAENYRGLTNGLFSPYLLRQLQYHGYGHSFPFQSSVPATCEMPRLDVNSIAPFKLDSNAGTATRISDGQLDLGGIGKGYAVQASSRWLKTMGKASSGIVDGGGDMDIWSNGEREWKIGVSHPNNPKKEIAQFSIKNGAVATSNVVYRSWMQGNEKKHHLLNGKTGLPIESNLIQATVITEHCLDAEVMAKLCFMESGQNLLNVLANISPNYSILLVDQNHQITTLEGSAS